MTDKKQDAEDPMAIALAALLVSGARFFDASARVHREELPKDSAAFATLAMQSGAKPGIRLSLFPDLAIEVGYTYKGEWAPFFSWSPPADAPDPRTLN